MKNRRRLVVGAFLLVAALCLSVGFATLQDTLTVDGTIAFNATKANEKFDDDVYFTDGSSVKTYPQHAAKGTNDVTFQIDSTDKDKLTITVDDTVFSAAGEELVVDLKVQNDSTDSATVAAVTAAKTASGCEVTSTASTLTAGEAGTVTLTIKFTDTSTTSATFTVELDVTSAN